MTLFEDQLIIKRSTLPGAGKGLFTKKNIMKGTYIVEYKGKVDTWKNTIRSNIDSRYIFYITRNKVIDAGSYIKALARYANDANGLTKKNGLRNNSEYAIKNSKVYIKATNNIPAGSEILVEYGKEYWDIIKQNEAI